MTPFLTLVSCWILSSAATLVVATDHSLSLQWWALTLWLGSFLPPLVLLALRWKKANSRTSFAAKHQPMDKPAVLTTILLLLFVIPYFLFLESYPFLSIWDEVRDGGLNTRQILDGSILNLFKYGRYNSHGLIIPTLLGPFYKVFGNSPLTYRVPAALLSALTGILVYRLGTKCAGRAGGLIAAATTLSATTHLYFGRTQVVPVLSSFFTALLLNLYWRSDNQKPQVFEVGCLSVFCGFISGFHTSIRTVAVVTLFFFLCKAWLAVFAAGTARLKAMRCATGETLAIVVSFFAGLGPRLLFSPAEIFFQARSFALLGNIPKTAGTAFELPADMFLKCVAFVVRYIESLGLYVGTKTTAFHLPESVAILPAFLGVFLIVGLLVSFAGIRNNPFSQLLLLLFWALPLSNSAVTEYPLLDNRLQPLLIVGSILCGMGLQRLLKAVRATAQLTPRATVMALAMALTALYWRELDYFIKAWSQQQYTNNNYLLEHLRIALDSDHQEIAGSKITIVTNEDGYRFLSAVHVAEFFHYFQPNLLVDLYQGDTSPKDTLEIFQACDKSESVTKQVCPSEQPFACPPKTTELYLKFSCLNAEHGLPAIVKGGPLVASGPPKYIP